jgi:DNA-binding CsgD family transcriptional regulator
MGMAAFADRASRELQAAGAATTRQQASPTAGNPVLTAQEAQIARLARDGMSNPEIAARMYLSRRTVQYHLGNVFAKLGISSRNQLPRVLPRGPDGD